MINLNKSLKFSYNVNVDNAYIITLKNHQESERLSNGCQHSCRSVGMPFQVWDAFDGTNGQEIKVPNHSKNSSYLSWLKVFDHHLSITEVACFFSHFSLWTKCIEQDQPLVILEHDSIMVKPYKEHLAYNSIVYLGSSEQNNKTMPVLSIPPHGTLNHNYHFICRAHAYAIDPIVAKNLVSYAIQRGICESLDVIMRADLFNISQYGLYAYDRFEGTTITNRKKDVRLSDDNIGNER
jgi:GR25 family glycosyltransferase involved in LPS biosynthesis